MAQLCVTIGAPTLAALRERRDAATRDADLVELRLDTLRRPGSCRRAPGTHGPVIVTCRPTWEGGHFPAARRRGCAAEARPGISAPSSWTSSAASLADAPWSARRTRSCSRRTTSTAFPSTWRRATRQCMRAEPGVVKLAVTAARLTDTLALLGLKPPSNRRASASRDGRARSGHAARARSLRVGLDLRRRRVGPGTDSGRSRLRRRIPLRQPLAARRALRRRRRVRRGTRCRRPCTTRAFAAAGLDAVYVPLEAETADDFLTFAGALGVARRERDAAVQDRLASPRRGRRAARRVGAVNTRAPRRPALVGRRTPTSRACSRRSGRAEPAGLACHGARRGRRRPGGGRGARRGRRARHRASPARRSRGARSPSRGRLISRRDAAAARQLGPARQRDVRRHASRCRRDAVARSPCFDGRLVYDLIYNPPETRLLARGARGGTARRSAASTCSSRRPPRSSTSGRASRPMPALMRAAAKSALAAFAVELLSPALITIMKLTTFDEFKELASRGTFVPVCKEIMADLLTPVSAFLKIAEHSDYAFLLESVEGGEHVGRYSFLGKDPFLVLARAMARTVDRARGPHRRIREKRSFPTLRRLMADFRSPYVPELPRFTGGAVGYLGLRRRALVRARAYGQRPLEGPAADADLAVFMLFDTVLAFDHVQHRLLIIANARITGDEDLEALYQFACAQIRFLEAELERSLSASRSAPGRRRSTLRSNMTRERFEANVRTAKEHIAAGDIYQVVLSQRFEADVAADPFTVYRALRHVNPSPYMYFMRMGGLAVVGSSPEMLVRVEGRHAQTHPIAGTRPRGRSGRRGPATGRGAEAQREGARRARHAGRSRTQRPRPRLRVRHGARAAVHGARALLARHAPGVRRRGHAGRRDGSPRRAGVVLPGGHRVWRAEGARHGNHLGARADAARHLRGRGRVSRLRRQPRFLHRDPHAS